MRSICSRKRDRSRLIEALEGRRLLTAVVASLDSGPGIASYYGVSAQESAPHDTALTTPWTLTVSGMPQHTHMDAWFEVGVYRTNDNDTNSDTFQLQVDGQTIETDSVTPGPTNFITGTDGQGIAGGYGMPHTNGVVSLQIIPTHLESGDYFQLFQGSVTVHQTLLITATQDGDADQTNPKDAIITITRDGTPAQALNVYYSINTNGIFDQPANQYNVPYTPDLSGANLATGLVYYPNNTAIYVATIPAGSDHVDVHYTNYVNANAYLSGIDIEVTLWNDVNADSATPALYDAPGTSVSPAVASSPWESYTALTDPGVPASQPAVYAAKVHDLKLRFDNASIDPKAPTAATYNQDITNLGDPDPAVRTQAYNNLDTDCSSYPNIAFEDALWNAYNDNINNGGSPEMARSLQKLLKQYFPVHVHLIGDTASSGPPQWSVLVDPEIWTWVDAANGWKPTLGNPYSSADVASWNVTVDPGRTNKGASTLLYLPNAANKTDGTGNAPTESATAVLIPLRIGGDTMAVMFSPYDKDGNNMFTSTGYDILQYYIDKA